MLDGQVPKFTSFKTKVAPKPDEPRGVTSGEHKGFRTLASGSSRPKSSTRKSRHVTAKSQEVAEVNLDQTSSHLFEIDGRGDSKNLIYGTLDRRHVPSYRRSGRGSLLGIAPTQTYDIVQGHGAESIVIADQRRRETLLSLQQIPSPLLDRQIEVLVQPSTEPDVIKGQDFVPLAEDSALRDTQSSTTSDFWNGSALSQGQRLDVLPGYTGGSGAMSPLEGNGSTTKTKADVGVSSNSGKGSKEIVHTWPQLIKEVEIQTNDAFHDRESREVDHQRARAEIKISIYQKALQQAPDGQDTETLTILLMKAARVIWERPKLDRKWKSVLDSGSQQLYLHYADYLMTTADGFQSDQVRQAYVDCMQKYQSLRPGIDKELGNLSGSGSKSLPVVLHTSQFLLESGHTELAICLWQALLEFALLKPKKQAPFIGVMDEERQMEQQAFEQFWDSGAPRVGEASEGVEVSSKSGRDPEYHTSADKMQSAGNATPDTPQRHVSWTLSEREKSRHYFFPIRLTDESDSSDPFRVVLFADLQPFLNFSAPSVYDPRKVLNAYLQFFKLPAVPGWPFGEDSPLALDLLLDRQTCPGLLSDVTRPVHLCVPNMQLDQHIMFSAEDWPTNLVSTVAWPSSSPHTIFLLRSLDQLICAGIGGEELAEYALSIELKLSPDTVRNNAKKYLKQMPSSLRLYNTLALIESRLGDPGKCQTILLKSLGMAAQLGREARDKSVMLWRTLLWHLLESGKNDEAMNLLGYFGQEGEITSGPEAGHTEPAASQVSKILQTENRLRSQCTAFLQSEEYHLAAITIECLLLHKYLQQPTGPGPVFSLFHELRPQLEHKNAAANEMVYQSVAHLIRFHVTKSQIIKLVEIREMLQELIDAFPLNTMFMSLYAWNESRLRIDDRLHSRVNNMILRSELKAGENIVFFSFLIDLELGRHEKGLVQASSVRSAFERAVASEICAHSAAIWQGYVHFELHEKDLRRAEKVVLRAIRACPWVKEFFLLAFEHLGGPDGMDETTSQALHVLMEERGIRVHEDFEDG